MPNRLLKEGIVDSSAINELTSEEEVFFYRLLVVSDDYGLMDARLPILKSRCFPLKDIKSEKLESWLLSLVRHKLVSRYQIDGKPYLKILKWEQRVRSKAKYPMPDDSQMIDIGHTNDSELPTIDCLGKGKGKGMGASNRITFDAVNRKFLNIEQTDKDLWSKAYPAVDIELEINKAIVWLVANPTKVKSNYQKFLTGWFNRSQDRGGNKPKSSTNQYGDIFAPVGV